MSSFSVRWRTRVIGACALFVVGSVARAQNDPGKVVTLRGVVLDSALRPLPGALVYLASARAFTVSDDEGRYTLRGIETRTDTLQVRGLGFRPRAFRMDLRDAVGDTIDLGMVALDPGPPPTLTLTVTAEDTVRGKGIVGADVLVNDRSVGRTDAAGVYAGTALPVNWGINAVLVRRPGYAPLIGSIWVGELDAHESLTGTMQPQAYILPEVVVEADRIRFQFNGPEDFWWRRSFGQGRYFTRADIERRRPTRVTDLLLSTSFLEVSRWSGTRRVQATSSGERCTVPVWINGSPLPVGEDMDTFVHPREVTAIEVYRGFEIPPEFGALNGCGAILIWTW